MLDTLTGFVVVGVAIALGWILGRIDLLGPHARHVLSRLTFFVLSPFLLFVVLAQADVHTLFSALLPVSAIAAVAVFIVYAVVARFVWRRGVAETLIGTLSAGQVNSNNIGIPLSLYLLGSAAYPAPVILLQLLVFTPVTMAIFEAVTSGQRRAIPILRRTVTNPIVVGSVLGVLVSLSGIRLPPIALDPLQLIADACVPVLLISYGISLHGQRILGPSGRRRDILLASVLKLAAMPLVAWVVAAFVFHLSPHDVLIVTVIAALPTAQNVFNYAQRFDVGETIARDTVFLTTVGCVPVLLLIVTLLG
ncbi:MULTISPECIES: AEC family transporter [Microbacterium]|uniref:AEC family transporter n=1 Tax=Microbacterium TaxID=33882 RepID=UPI00198ADC53|nr:MULTISPECIES: AEC family transporter [Microbacterium]MBD3756877.1 AEC family transporter [Microbacterium sp.]MCG7415294.1 AEC family transporter [Microbacterium aurum]